MEENIFKNRCRRLFFFTFSWRVKINSIYLSHVSIVATIPTKPTTHTNFTARSGSYVEQVKPVKAKSEGEAGYENVDTDDLKDNDPGAADEEQGEVRRTEKK